jgi:hypothetical protein
LRRLASELGSQQPKRTSPPGSWYTPREVVSWEHGSLELEGLARALGALTSPPLTTSFLLSSAATLPPRSTCRHPRARPTIASNISRQTTRHARAPACGCAAAGTGGAEMGQRWSSARAEAGQPLCWWNIGVDPGCKLTTTHSSLAVPRSSVGACSGRGRHRRGGGERRARRRTDLRRPAGTGGNLKVGTGGDLKVRTGGGIGARSHMLLSWWRRRRERVRLPSCSRG